MSAREALPYLAGAYGAVFALVVLYVGMMRARLARMEQEVARLEERLGTAPDAAAPPQVRSVPATTERRTPAGRL